MSLEQRRLDVKDRTRTSRLPWRGQFSPELVEYLMKAVCPDSTRFLDPFAGSGTVMFEALREGKSAWGLEVNPAAWHLGVLSSYSMLTHSEKTRVRREVMQLRADHSSLEGGLFQRSKPVTSQLDRSSDLSFVNLAVAASLILGMGNATGMADAALANGAKAVLEVLEEIQNSAGSAHCFLRDARRNGLDDESVDGVITSPPYINVFNYHQNYRTAAELLGWKPLEAARSEIGANRKHRQNRFLTVVQYCLDMHDCLVETARAMRPNAPLVIVLGRTSNVLGAAFENGAIVKELINRSGCFGQLHRQERVFTNRYGEQIFEDILITRRLVRMTRPLADMRAIGVEALKRATSSVPERNASTLAEALEAAEKVQPSPLLSLTCPPRFADR